MKQYYIYILKCNDSSYYTGVTNDVDKRLFEHEQGLDARSYTYSRRPVHVCYVEEFDNINDAIAREKQIKGWSRRKKEALIAEDSEQLIMLAKAYGLECRPSTGSLQRRAGRMTH